MTESYTKHPQSETLVLAEHLGEQAATQPCSGVTIVATHAFSPGSGTASPAIVKNTKSAA